jgi:hypothetical protein
MVHSANVSVAFCADCGLRFARGVGALRVARGPSLSVGIGDCGGAVPRSCFRSRRGRTARRTRSLVLGRDRRLWRPGRWRFFFWFSAGVSVPARKSVAVSFDPPDPTDRPARSSIESHCVLVGSDPSHIQGEGAP